MEKQHGIYGKNPDREFFNGTDEALSPGLECRL
jgi:hypothetical protein